MLSCNGSLCRRPPGCAVVEVVVRRSTVVIGEVVVKEVTDIIVYTYDLVSIRHRSRSLQGVLGYKASHLIIVYLKLTHCGSACLITVANVS